MKKNNPAVYFEIPVNDLQRAQRFYETVFGFRFETDTVDGYEMALFPFTEEATGITGALAKGDVYHPSKTGVILYLHAPDINAVLKKAAAVGGKILYPKKDNGDAGFVAEVEDSEGNRIGLHQPKK